MSASSPHSLLFPRTTADAEESGVLRVELGRYIVLSTAHIQESDAAVLTSQASMGGACQMMVASTGYGFLVTLLPGGDSGASADAIQSMRAAGLSDAFVSLWLGVRNEGFGILQLDSDGPICDLFPTFDW